jgi:tripartite-type tricarboxylate transporter receptor subunit TctC
MPVNTFAFSRRYVLAATVATNFLFPLGTADADPVADFYRGKTLNMIIATSPGGDYDTRGRLLARHMGRHIPGEPAIVARNMPGAVGLQAANWLALQAPRRYRAAYDHAEHAGASSTRRSRRRIRYPQVPVDRQYDRQSERGEFLAHHRHPHAGGCED